MSHRATSRQVQGEQAARIRPEDRRAFTRAVNTLNDLIARVREYEPEANYYVSGSELNLMIGEPWEETGGRVTDRQDRIALYWTIDNADCGAW